MGDQPGQIQGCLDHSKHNTCLHCGKPVVEQGMHGWWHEGGKQACEPERVAAPAEP